MQLTYEKRSEGFSVEWKKSTHVPPHLHEAIEIIYVTDGTVELGVGEELYHMDKGDFAIVFPNVIHHYQVFDSGKNKAIYLFFDPVLSANFFEELQKYSPEYPIIKKDKLHTDVANAVKTLAKAEECSPMLIQAYVQIILAHAFSEMNMVEKETVGSEDLVYKSVEYVAKNYCEKISLEQMAYDLGISKYVLSRLFAKTFHCNFASYVNGIRLNYAISMLDGTNKTITTICFESGFESQRTFNRVFKERYRVTPREYRLNMHTIETS